MIKSFLILTSFVIILFAHEQIILVVSDDFNSSKARLSCYEGSKVVFSDIDVNIGKNGLGWGIGMVKLHKNPSDATKKEGDLKAPAGIFKLTESFGYAKEKTYNIPYLHTQNLICVDDSDSPYYNQIIKTPKNKPKSFEIMQRDDNQYEIGVVVAHNTQQKPLGGSCIFLHIQKYKDAPTAGCTSMKKEDLQKIVQWLDIKKEPILIQVPKSSLEEVYQLYPQLNNKRVD